MFRVVNGMAPACLTDLFTRKQEVTNYSLRVPVPRCNYLFLKQRALKKAFHMMGQRSGNPFRRIYAIVNQCPHLRLKLPLTHYFNELNFYSKFLDSLVYFNSLFFSLSFMHPRKFKYGAQQ